MTASSLALEIKMPIAGEIELSDLRDNRQADKAGVVRRVPNALRRLLIIPRLRIENIRHKFLRVAIVQREQSRLHLDHDAMPRQKNVIYRRKAETV